MHTSGGSGCTPQENTRVFEYLYFMIHSLKLLLFSQVLCVGNASIFAFSDICVFLMYVFWA